ncbi:MAG: hypothetical protein JW910_11750, partial [Anaerolineae bacterium]|nr:hypothetical protein [Anaerolineae bacterium]
DSAVFFSFEGDTFTLYRRVGPTDGVMRVCIDGACSNVSNTDPVKQWGVPVTFSGLGAGLHTVGVYRVPGSKLFFDAVWVGPGAPSGPIQSPDDPGTRDTPDTPVEPRHPDGPITSGSDATR